MGQKEIDEYRAQVLRRKRQYMDEALIEHEPNFDDPSELDPEDQDALSLSPEPWNVVVTDPIRKIPVTVEHKSQLMLYLEQHDMELEEFLSLPQAEQARNAGLFAWLEDLYVSAGL